MDVIMIINFKVIKLDNLVTVKKKSYLNYESICLDNFESLSSSVR